ncbi:MAG: tol-pal system-associated acyl-CoA thioesterase [Cellvibrionaceae bacterium]
MTKEFIHSIRVYIEDTDAGGIVYYVNYLKYIERSRTEFLRSLGYGKAAVLEDGLLLVVRSTQIDYLLPARLDDEIMATASLQKVAKTYVVFEQEVRRDNDILCRATVKVACVTQKEGNMRPAAMPTNMRDSLNDYL